MLLVFIAISIAAFASSASGASFKGVWLNIDSETRGLTKLADLLIGRSQFGKRVLQTHA